MSEEKLYRLRSRPVLPAAEVAASAAVARVDGFRI